MRVITDYVPCEFGGPGGPSSPGFGVSPLFTGLAALVMLSPEEQPPPWRSPCRALGHSSR